MKMLKNVVLLSLIAAGTVAAEPNELVRLTEKIERGRLGASGAFSPSHGSPCLLPVVQVAAQPWTTSADVETGLTTVFDALPRADWQALTWTLSVEAVPVEALPATLLRYRFTNTGDERFHGRLLLVMRPLSLDGTRAPITNLETEMDEPMPLVEVNGKTYLECAAPPSTIIVAGPEQGDILDALATRKPELVEAVDEKGMVSGAVIYELHLAPGAASEMIVSLSADGGFHEHQALLEQPVETFERNLKDQVEHWKEVSDVRSQIEGGPTSTR